MIYRSSQFHESGWLGKHGWWFIQSKSSWMWTSGCLISNGLGRPSTLALVAFFILHIIISQVEAVIATHILSSSQHLIGLILVKTWENGWQSHALDWLPQFVPDFLNFFLIFLGRFTSFLQWVPKSWKYPKKSKRREGADKATEDFFRDERKKIIMVTGNEDHDQNVVGHLCMNEPKKKDREKTKNKARTLWNYEICSPNQLRDSQTDTTAILAGETQKDRPRMDGHSIGTRPLRRGERNENCATASRWFISRYTFCLKIPPIFSFLFFFQKA